MRYVALATDFDGTLATHGHVDPGVLGALQRARDSGLCLVLVTGRVWPELQAVFPEYRVFNRIVVENGALLVDPETGEESLLASAASQAFVARLSELGVSPLSVGRSIVATWEPHQNVVLGAIRELGLELQVIFNKGAVMVLPSGVNKASGLVVALSELGISRHNCVGIGDAENDHALLEQSELAVAVANAVPTLKDRADWVTAGERGDGVLEVLDEWLETGLGARHRSRDQSRLVLGTEADGNQFGISSQGSRLLICGSSGSGKSTLTSAVLEQLTELGYQYCVIDPEGDFQTAPGRVVFGDAEHVPDPGEVIQALGVTPANVVVNLLGVPIEKRSLFGSELLQRLRHHQERWGRPHWVVVDEAHHLLENGMPVDPEQLHDPASSLLLITVHPDHLHPGELAGIDTVVVIGSSPGSTLRELQSAHGLGLPEWSEEALAPGIALAWSRQRPGELVEIASVEPRQERRRHQRKYAVGELGQDKSFYFRGPDGALNLRAHNLALFLQIADGVDPETWNYHRARNDYSRWLREAVKDRELAAEVLELEAVDAPAEESRAHIRQAIDRRYTLPA